MALTERSRAALYQGLHAIIDDEEAIGEVLSNFPARDVEEPATTEFVRAEMSQMEQRLVVYIHQEVRGSQHWTVGLMFAMFTVLGLLVTLT